MPLSSPPRRRIGLLLVLGSMAVSLTGADSPDGAASEEAIQAGRALFARAWMPGDPRARGGDGLGPVFNAQSCLACHDRGGPGGAGTAERNIEIVSATRAGFATHGQGYGFSYSFGMDLGAGRFEYTMASNSPTPATKPRPLPPIDPAVLASIHPGLQGPRGVVLHRFGIDPAYQVWRNGVLGGHGSVVIRSSQRNPTPLFGAGLIDAIPDDVIAAGAQKKGVGVSKTKGRVSRMADGRVGRFGWKAQTATLREFTLSAAATEIGLEVPGHHQAADPRLPGLGAPGLDLDGRDCDSLVAYVRSLPAPVSTVPDDADDAAGVVAGEATFRAIGCASCHVPKLGDVEGIYSDLLLHDMSDKLADTAGYGVFGSAGADGPALAGGPRVAEKDGGATAQEWRTPPLWGLRDSAPYLHDGRAATVDQAVHLHGGQGAASAQRYAQLTGRRKRQIDAFLLSLAAPGRDDQREALARGR